MINKNDLSWLTSCPASDCNFKGHLNDSNIETLREALKDKSISKAARKAIEIKIRKLEK